VAWLSSLLESIPSFLRPEDSLPLFYEALRLQALDLATSELFRLGRTDLVTKLDTIFPQDAAAFIRRAWAPPPKREKPATCPSPPDALSAALDDVEKEYKHSRTQAYAIKIMVDARLSALKSRVIAEGESLTHGESRFQSLTSAESGTILKMCPTQKTL
jgi:hypothetical protein